MSHSRPSRPPSQPSLTSTRLTSRTSLPTARPLGRASRYGLAALESEAERLLTSSKGSRHNALYASSARIGELVAGGELEHARARDLLCRTGLKLKPGFDSEILRTVEQGLKRGAETAREAPSTGAMVRDASDARLRLLAMLTLAQRDQARWAGVTGGTDLKVLVGLSTLALHAGKLRVGASYRQIAEASGVSIGSLRRALGSLEGRFIRRVHLAGPFRRADRSVFQFVTPVEFLDVLLGVTSEQAGGSSYGEGRQCSIVASPRRELLREGLRDPSHPLWSRRAAAWRVFMALDDERRAGEWVTPSELAEGLLIPLQTVRRSLRFLAVHGLLESSERSHTVPEPERALAAVSHLEPLRNKRLERHRLDRERHRLFLAARSIYGCEAAGASALEMRHRFQRDAEALVQARAAFHARWARFVSP